MLLHVAMYVTEYPTLSTTILRCLSSVKHVLFVKQILQQVFTVAVKLLVIIEMSR